MRVRVSERVIEIGNRAGNVRMGQRASGTKAIVGCVIGWETIC